MILLTRRRLGKTSVKVGETWGIYSAAGNMAICRCWKWDPMARKNGATGLSSGGTGQVFPPRPPAHGSLPETQAALCFPRWKPSSIISGWHIPYQKGFQHDNILMLSLWENILSLKKKRSSLESFRELWWKSIEWRANFLQNIFECFIYWTSSRTN